MQKYVQRERSKKSVDIQLNLKLSFRAALMLEQTPNHDKMKAK